MRHGLIAAGCGAAACEVLPADAMAAATDTSEAPVSCRESLRHWGSGGATCGRLLLEPFGPASRDGRVATQAAQRIEPCGKRIHVTTTLLTAIGPSRRLVIKPSLHRREAQP